jgi:uncharacterized iron-regulated membrane protein
MRAIHRWLMTVFFFTLLYWVASGLLMAIYDATDPHQVWAIEGGGPGARLGDATGTGIATALPDPADLIDGVVRAQSALGTLAVASVDLRMAGDLVRLQFADASGSRNTMNRFNAVTGEPITQRQAEGNPDATPPAYVTKRNNLKTWHRGNAAGLTGQFVGLFTGLGLVALATTGIVLYLQIWRVHRRAKGLMSNRSFFWSARESTWRTLHRWVAIVSAVFVLNIAVSGTILAASEIKLNLFLQHGVGSPPYPRPSPLPPVSAARLPVNVNVMLQTAWQAARNMDANRPVTAIQLVHRDGIAKSLVTVGGEQPSTLAFDATAGTAVADWATAGHQVGSGYYADWHQFVKRMHRGDVIGSFKGRYIDLTAGLALLYLVVSGGIMYLQQRGQRTRMGVGAWSR